MRHTLGKATFVGCALVFLVLGCKSSAHDRPAVTVTTGATEPMATGMLMNDDAAMLMTNARCQLDSACAAAGASRFDNPNLCRLAFLPEASAVVRDEDCPAGVDRARLSICVDAIRNQGCVDPGAAIDAPASCKRSELCASP